MTFEEIKALHNLIGYESDWAQHANGGGWKHRTASVPESCYLAESAVVGNECKLGNRCTLGYGCKLGDDCTLGYGCKLGDRCKLGNECKLGNRCTLGYGCKLGDRCTKTLYMQPVGGHPITAADDGYVQIGCMRGDLSWWLDHHQAVGRKEKYTESLIAEYELHLRHCAAWLEMVRAGKGK